MKGFFNAAGLIVVAVTGSFQGSSAVRAETTTHCDDACGETQKCKYICCHITKEKKDGIEYVTNISCNSSTCCAHPDPQTVGSAWHTPTRPVDGPRGAVLWELTAAALDASSIKVEVDDTLKTVTLTGSVRSPEQVRKVEAIARKQVKGYRLTSKLTVDAGDPDAKPKKGEGMQADGKKAAGK